jgi:hypothetical protein
MRFKATADVPAPLICGRFHFQHCASNIIKKKARVFARAFLIFCVKRLD